MDGGGGDGADDASLGIAAQRGLEDAGQLAVAIRDMAARGNEST